MSKILMPMVDGGIVNYVDDTSYTAGCETCDYGSEYVNDITITLTKHEVHAVLNQMYGYAISEGDLMKTLLPAYEEIRAMTESQFVEWFKACLLSMIKEHDAFASCDEIFREYTVKKREGAEFKSVLKPCPFCGNRAEMKVTEIEGYGGFNYSPRCSVEDCAGRLTKQWVTQEKAIAAWNRRSSDG